MKKSTIGSAIKTLSTQYTYERHTRAAASKSFVSYIDFSLNISSLLLFIWFICLCLLNLNAMCVLRFDNNINLFSFIYLRIYVLFEWRAAASPMLFLFSIQYLWPIKMEMCIQRIGVRLEHVEKDRQNDKNVTISADLSKRKTTNWLCLDGFPFNDRVGAFKNH